MPMLSREGGVHGQAKLAEVQKQIMHTYAQQDETMYGDFLSKVYKRKDKRKKKTNESGEDDESENEDKEQLDLDLGPLETHVIDACLCFFRAMKI